MSETTETALANLDQTYYASVLTFLHNQIVSLADRRMLRTVEDELHIPIKYQSLQYVKLWFVWTHVQQMISKIAKSRKLDVFQSRKKESVSFCWKTEDSRLGSIFIMIPIFHCVEIHFFLTNFCPGNDFHVSITGSTCHDFGDLMPA